MSTAQTAKDAGQIAPRQSGARPVEGPCHGVMACNGQTDFLPPEWIEPLAEQLANTYVECPLSETGEFVRESDTSPRVEKKPA